MAAGYVLECSFLIPLRRDAEISDGELHAPQAWQWLRNELYSRFDGWTIAPGIYEGAWKNARTRQPIHDQTRRFIVALAEERVAELRQLLRDACEQFDQQCIYLSVAGEVEFVGPEP